MTKPSSNLKRQRCIRPGCVVKVVAHGNYSGCCGTVSMLLALRSSGGGSTNHEPWALVVFGPKAHKLAKSRTRDWRLTHGLSGDVSWVKDRAMFPTKQLVLMTRERPWDSETI